MEWQPIETAPKDGATIVAIRAEAGLNVPSFVFWCYNDGWCGLTAEDEKRLVKYQPTHWMPLPEPPST